LKLTADERGNETDRDASKRDDPTFEGFSSTVRQLAGLS
jgi:hypothetical protein